MAVVIFSTISRDGGVADSFAEPKDEHFSALPVPLLPGPYC